MSLGRAWQWATALTLAALVSGCATWRPAAPDPSAAPPAVAAHEPQAESAPATTPTTPAVATAVRLDIDAPSELKALLQRHLDLARLAQLPVQDGPSEAELQRVESSTPAQVRALLETEGYFSPTIRVQRAPTNQDGSVSVLVSVQAGRRTVVDQLKFEVQGELERLATGGDTQAQATIESLRELWPMDEGYWFRNNRWTDGKAALLAKLRAEGYTSASWAGTAADIDAAGATARLTLILDSGPRYRLGAMTIEGLVLHEASTVRNLAGFEPGAPATETALLDFQERLVRTGLFDRVSVVLDVDNAEPAGTGVLVRLSEAPIQQATLGLGISANTGPRVSAEHTHRRVFGQRGTLRNKFELGRLRQAWEGELSSHAQPNLYRNLVGGSFERLVAADDSDVVRSWRLRVGRTRETTAREHFTFAQLERAERSTAIAREGITGLSLNHHAVWRQVDSVVLPTKGEALSVQTGLGMARGADDQGPYARLSARLSLWQPLGGRWFGQARLELGQVLARDSLALPQTQLFRVGGDDSVRGYAYRSLGPIVDGSVGGGRVMATGSVELARPLAESLPSVWGAVFADAGQAANRWGEWRPVWGAGVGVRWRSPVGPLSLDWAWGEATRRSRLHLSVGIVF